MASATDVLTATYTALWALLEGRPEWAALVKPGCRVKLGTKDMPDNWRDNLQDADYPRATLIQMDGADSVVTTAQTFGNTFGACGARIESLQRTYVLGITHRGLQLAANNQLDVETLAALRAGPAAVNAAVKAIAPAGGVKVFGPIRYSRDDSGRAPQTIRGAINTNGRPRAASVFQIPVVLVFSGAAPLA